MSQGVKDEILRATLQASCVTSRSVWYGDEATYAVPVQASVSPYTSTGVIRIRENSHFLLMNTAYCLATYNNTIGTGLGYANPQFTASNQYALSYPLLQLQNLDNSRTYTMPIGLAQDVGSDLIAPRAQTQYIYLEPGHRLKWTFVNRAPNLAAGPNSFATVSLVFGGIEYFMKGSKDGQAS